MSGSGLLPGISPSGAGGAAGGQPDALLAPDEVWEIPPAGAHRKLSELAPTVALLTALGLLPQSKEFSRHGGSTALTGGFKRTMQQCK